MPFSELPSLIKSLEDNTSLLEEKNFDRRMDAIEMIDFEIIGQIDDLLQKTGQTNQLTGLKRTAEKIKRKLEKRDEELFPVLQEKIRQKNYPGENFRSLIAEYFSVETSMIEHYEEAAYDNLDIFINRLICFRQIPEPSRLPDQDMIYYQKTPVRVLFDLVEKAGIQAGDVFFDIGSGLGQATLLVHLLTGARSTGIEIDPAFCHYAQDAARALHLSGVCFSNQDARLADYSKGTVFFMFTPFKGKMLEEVLALLKKESEKRQIKVLSYGPCTPIIAEEKWLDSSEKKFSIYRPALWTSRG